jgi:hypothetical protein
MATASGILNWPSPVPLEPHLRRKVGDNTPPIVGLLLLVRVPLVGLVIAGAAGCTIVTAAAVEAGETFDAVSTSFAVML